MSAAFQTGHAGSIPVTRSTAFTSEDGGPSRACEGPPSPSVPLVSDLPLSGGPFRAENGALSCLHGPSGWVCALGGVWNPEGSTSATPTSPPRRPNVLGRERP
jgi:hypothetical protein